MFRCIYFFFEFEICKLNFFKLVRKKLSKVLKEFCFKLKFKGILVRPAHDQGLKSAEILSFTFGEILRHDISLYYEATRDKMPKWSKNDHFLDLK